MEGGELGQRQEEGGVTIGRLVGVKAQPSQSNQDGGADEASG